MKIWVDAQLSPAIARWMQEQTGVETIAVRDLGLRDATDYDIFMAARKATAVVMTKDSDFVQLIQAHGTPPQVIWLTCGNTSNIRLQDILSKTLSQALTLLTKGEKIVEIRDR